MNDFTIFVVDDDEKIRVALKRLLASFGYRVLCFPSAEAFLEQHDPSLPGCLVLDVVMPGIHGLKLQEQLSAIHCHREIVFLTAQGTIPDSVQAMKAGASDFLTKPVDRDTLLRAISAAITRDTEVRHRLEERLSIEKRLQRLTPREREVMQHVVRGQLNKQIASDLRASEKTIKIHRARGMEKMEADSVATLVHLCALAESTSSA